MSPPIRGWSDVCHAISYHTFIYRENHSHGISNAEEIMKLEKEYGLFIGGKWVPASDGGKFVAKCAANGQVLAECAEATEADARMLLEKVFS